MLKSFSKIVLLPLLVGLPASTVQGSTAEAPETITASTSSVGASQHLTDRCLFDMCLGQPLSEIDKPWEKWRLKVRRRGGKPVDALGDQRTAYEAATAASDGMRQAQILGELDPACGWMSAKSKFDGGQGRTVSVWFESFPSTQWQGLFLSAIIVQYPKDILISELREKATLRFPNIKRTGDIPQRCGSRCPKEFISFAHRSVGILLDTHEMERDAGGFDSPLLFEGCKAEERPKPRSVELD